jgi:predicted nucleic acid-binding protein
VPASRRRRSLSTSHSGETVNVLTVDANPLISALLRGEAARALFSPRIHFFTTMRTTWEVARYLPELAAELARRGARLDERRLLADFHAMPIVPLPDTFYESQMPEARRLIEARDPYDVDILALTLRLGVPLWTNDLDLLSLREIRALTTAELLAALR